MLPVDCYESYFQIAGGGPLDLDALQLQTQCRCGKIERLRLSHAARSFEIPLENRYMRKPGHKLFEKLQTLATQLGRKIRKSRKISPGTRQTSDKLVAN